MKPLKKFEDFLKEGVIKKQEPDLSRANFLIKDSERKQKSMKITIEKIGLSEINAPEIIEYCYDIIMGLIRANLSKKGFKSYGEGSHEAEVSYLRNLDFSEPTVQFMDQLRYFRNRMKYYGKFLDKEYAERVLGFFNYILPPLKKINKKSGS